MPKHKRSREDEIDKYKQKIKKYEEKIRDRQSTLEMDAAEMLQLEDEIEADTPAFRPEDWLLQWPEDQVTQNEPEPQPGPSKPTEPFLADNNSLDLDEDVLEILGDDPVSTEKLGPEIRKELANRLVHVAKEGLNKEERKNLVTRYTLPANCAQVDAPKINPEIKAALLDAAVKRDKGIENKQRQMTSAIACLSEIINSQLTAPTRNKELLQKLMDITRILCDLQHADSITRRNFILFALKNDMKEHLKNTKIDTYLFGENLAETLKSAKAVNRSGVELKAEAVNKTKFRGTASRPLNRRAPPQARRPLAGTALPAPRSREPVAARAPFHPTTAYHPPPPQTQPSRTSSQPHQTAYPRRRY